MVICCIAVGSNLGERRFNIESAIRRVRTLANTRVLQVSSIMESAPEGGPAQGPYLNAVFTIQTDLTPYQLLQELQRIESLLGRVRTVVNGPRTIDLDILTYGDVRMIEPALCIPHPRMLQRDFVMVPLKEIAPEMLTRLKSKSRKVTRHPSRVTRLKKGAKTQGRGRAKAKKPKKKRSTRIQKRRS